MRPRKHFRAWACPKASDDLMDAIYIAVQGPRMNEFAVMDVVAAKIQRALNATQEPLTPLERQAACTALGFALAGEPDENWSDAKIAAMRRAHSKLGGVS